MNFKYILFIVSCIKIFSVNSIPGHSFSSLAPKTKFETDGMWSTGSKLPCRNGRLIKPSEDVIFETLYDNLVNKFEVIGNEPKLSLLLGIPSLFEESFQKYEMKLNHMKNAIYNVDDNARGGDQVHKYKTSNNFAESLQYGRMYSCNVNDTTRSKNRIYVTENQEFVLRTLRQDQFQLLEKQIDSYLEHVTSETSYLAKIRGVYKVGDEYLMVMDNLFYELNRQGGESEHLQVYDLNIHFLEHGNLMDDSDMQTIQSLSEGTREKIRAQLFRDIEYLESINISYFSLLIGLKGDKLVVAIVDTLSEHHAAEMVKNCIGLACSKCGPDSSHQKFTLPR